MRAVILSNPNRSTFLTEWFTVQQRVAAVDLLIKRNSIRAALRVVQTVWPHGASRFLLRSFPGNLSDAPSRNAILGWVTKWRVFGSAPGHLLCSPYPYCDNTRKSRASDCCGKLNPQRKTAEDGEIGIRSRSGALRVVFYSPSKQMWAHFLVIKPS
ncbi:unnamed protein product [Timema podura]|uniref:Uncharacterized protein n=1 Tax=Timema podura TaxID=61482 RepID=A0ABN7NVK8_TIMPD|nr:unnamed protein product [Timema podura]